MGERLDGVLAHVADRSLVEEALEQLRGALDAWRDQVRSQRSAAPGAKAGES